MKSPYKVAIVFDLETSGFDPVKNVITEAAFVAVDMDTLLVIDEMSVVIEPQDDRVYDPKAMEVTGITEEFLREKGVPYNDAYITIQTFFLKHKVGNSKPVLCGHNIDTFDTPFIEQFFKENGIKDIYKLVSKHTFDTLKRAREMWFTMPNFKLATVASELDVELKDAHRAIDDTRANAEVFIKMMGRSRGAGASEEAASDYVRRKFKFNF